MSADELQKAFKVLDAAEKNTGSELEIDILKKYFMYQGER